MRSSAFQRILVGVWVSLLLAPLALTVGRVKVVSPVAENRRKSPAPVFGSFKDSRQYVEASINWFQDSYGGRDELIRLKNQLDYSVFNKSDRIHIGRDGFLFYRSLLDVTVPEIDRTPPMTISDRVRSISALAKRLAERNAKLIVVAIPLKHTIYPNLLPPSAPPLAKDRRFDQFCRELAEAPGIVFFDTTPVLREFSGTGNAFNRTDFHWSEPAAAAVGRRLLEKIAEDCVESHWSPSWKVEFVPRSFSGGQAMFMPLLRTPSETALFPKIEPPYPREGTEPPFDWVVRASELAGKLPPVLYIGDSFIWALHNTGFTQEFEVFRFAHILRPGSRELYRKLPEGTRYVVLQLLETMILTDFAPL